MSEENKSKLDELRQKLYDKKQELMQEKAKEQIEEELTHVAYDIFQDPETKSRKFLMVKIKYNPETKKATVMDVKDFEDKPSGLTFVMNKSNNEYLYNKSNKRSKK